MNKLFDASRWLISASTVLLTLTGACNALLPPAAVPPQFYSLDNARTEIRPAPTAAAMRPTAPTLIVNPARATSGFNSRRIIYTREPHLLEYYAHSEWVDTPARMLAPLLVTALESSGAFRAVILTPSAAVGELRLDTEIIRLQHDLSSQPSTVRFTLRAYVVDNTTRQVLARHEFDERVAVSAETPYGSVVAGNQAVRQVLGQLAIFCEKIADDL